MTPAHAYADTPAAQFAPTETFTSAQLWFLAFHTRRTDPPMQWTLHWSGTLLRATTELGQTASIPATEFGALVDAGLMRRVGEYGADITPAGREVVRK